MKLKDLFLKPKEWRDVYLELVSAGVMGLFGLLSLVKLSWLQSFGNLAATRLSVPAWALGFGVLAVLFWLLSVIRRLRVPAHISNYHEDEIDMVLWRWNYTDGKISNLTPFCAKPDCGTELHVFEVQHSDGGIRPSPQPTVHVSYRQLYPPKQGPGALTREMSDVHGTVLYCTSCNKSFAIKNAFDLPDHARRKIEKRIRDKTWNKTRTVA